MNYNIILNVEKIMAKLISYTQPTEDLIESGIETAQELVAYWC